ncbi:uncharacterized protein LOC113753528 isoform X2 [Coffea eugenioides]|uniref:uncharacterized protein LOC113753528 isoform X2 n=1 Tax=Coffea eugenioides TaxID=49369 RepID=UPI000F60DB33|nr:uncharacterized protein LOC113753528 isoform X2 [Coffea eugenioides]
MAEEICLFIKDGLIIKAPKKSPVLLRTIVLVFVMVCGVYTCSVCLKQTNFSSKTKFLNIEVRESYCHEYDIDRSQTPCLHYPKPKTFHRAECSCNPVRLFAILSMQRSGSGWFETLLNSHVNVSSNGEIFSVKGRRENASSITKTLDRVYNLDWFTSASKNQCSAAVGFKWMLNQAETLSRYKPVINLTSLMTDLKQMEVTVMKTLEQFQSTRHIILYYEDLVKNRTKLVDVQEFLKLPLMELTSRQVKIHKGPLSEHIENWDDVNKTLQGTLYERFLHADY